MREDLAAPAARGHARYLESMHFAEDTAMARSAWAQTVERTLPAGPPPM